MANRRINRDFSFELQVDRDVRMSHVLQGLLQAVGKDARGVNPFGNGRFTVTTTTKSAAEVLFKSGRLQVAGRGYPLVPLASITTLVTVHFLPVEVPNEDLLEVMKNYGKVLSVTREYFREAPTVEKGSRRVILEMKTDVPNYVEVDGFKVMCIYAGMKKTCRRCGEAGHFSFHCRTPQCKRCGDYGHYAGDCTAKCKRCGEDHATTSCTAFTYASVTAPAADNTEPPDVAALEDDASTEVASPAVTAEPSDLAQQPMVLDWSSEPFVPDDISAAVSPPVESGAQSDTGDSVLRTERPEQPTQVTEEAEALREPQAGRSAGCSDDNQKDLCKVAEADNDMETAQAAGALKRSLPSSTTSEGKVSFGSATPGSHLSGRLGELPCRGRLVSKKSKQT